MYDTVNFWLPQSKAGGVDFLTETPYYLENVGEHIYNNGEIVITGNLNGLKIILKEHQMKIRDGSLCKWYLGDNFQTMGRGDTQKAIERLSDTLHVPIREAIVTRLDIGRNFETRFPPEVYFNHLGSLRNFIRLKEPNGIYYCQSSKQLCFYDKIAEPKAHKAFIPKQYEGKNVLRYELRYLERIAAKLHMKEVTAAMLYDEAFYIGLMNRWGDAYMAIQKINDASLNFQAMKSKSQLYKMGVVSLTEQVGGLLQMIEQIKEFQKRGELSNKQAFDLRQAVNDA